MRMTLPTTCLALALALGVAGCDRGSEAAPATTAAETAANTPATPEAPVAATETTMAVAGVQPDARASDGRALAGTFEGTLPCADCPGIDERLVLSADGTFELTDRYRERPGSETVAHGSWSLEPDGKAVRLDPGSKTAQDRLYALQGNDTLVPLGADGQPTGAPGDPRLQRAR